MDRLIEAFQDDCKIRGMAPVSIRTYIKILNMMDRFFNKPLTEVNKFDIQSYVADCRKRGLVTKTIASRLTVLSSFFEFAIFNDMASGNPVPATRKRYLEVYKADGEKHRKKLISVEEAIRLIRFAIDIRNKAMLVLLLLTGIRAHELIELDITDINWKDQSILLKDTKKRTNKKVYFPDEVAYILKLWVKAREMRFNRGTDALFLSSRGNRISYDALYYAVQSVAELAGLHDPGSKRPEDHFGPHCCRHFFTRQLRRAGMPREFIKELRGDARREAIDCYDPISEEELRESYLAYIPDLKST